MPSIASFLNATAPVYPTIYTSVSLSSTSIAEDAAVSTVVGALSVVNGSGVYTFTETADPDSKFAISDSNLTTSAALDYETATSHSVTISADNGVDDPISATFTITVTNVFEAANLAALTLDDNEIAVGVAATVNIVGATAGSTITGSVPAGLTLNSAARTITGTPTTIATNSITLTETLADSANSPRVTSGLALDVAFSPASLFAASEQGVWYYSGDISTVWQDAARTTPGAVGQPVGRIDDKSGNGNHATQATTASKPMYQTAPDRLTLDKVDDRLLVTVPTGGFSGTMVLATPEGTAAYGVTIPAGSYAVGGTTPGGYFPGTAIQGCVIRNGAMTQGEIDQTIAYMRDEGGGLDYGAVTNFSNYWRSRSEITSFPLIDTSAVTNFLYAWRGCSSLTSFPLINTSKGTNFLGAWFGCTSLTSFPLIDTSAVVSFGFAWSFCSSLTSFPSNFFDGCAATDFGSAFTTTNLNQASIDGILVSINSNGTSNGTFNQSGGSAPSATGQAAITAMRARGWTVTVTGGF